MTTHHFNARPQTAWSELRGVALRILADFARTA